MKPLDQIGENIFNSIPGRYNFQSSARHLTARWDVWGNRNTPFRKPPYYGLPIRELPNDSQFKPFLIDCCLAGVECELARVLAGSRAVRPFRYFSTSLVHSRSKNRILPGKGRKILARPHGQNCEASTSREWCEHRGTAIAPGRATP